MGFRATVLLICMAAAAPVDADPIAACRAAHESSPTAHIACLEDAVRTAGAASAQPIQAVSDAPAAVAIPAAPAATVSVAPPPAGLGAEQVTPRQGPTNAATEPAAVRIVAVSYTASGLGTFRMADGQVWLGTEASPMRVQLQPGREYAARIERGKTGGYRMYVDGVTWMHKVRRLQ
jgi:hypothetical protein